MREQKLSVGIAISKMEKGQWSFGVCFSHYFDETYYNIAQKRVDDLGN